MKLPIPEKLVANACLTPALLSTVLRFYPFAMLKLRRERTAIHTLATA